MAGVDWLQFKQARQAQRNVLQHSAKGTTWKDHLYKAKETIGGKIRYIYDSIAGPTKVTNKTSVSVDGKGYIGDTEYSFVVRDGELYEGLRGSDAQKIAETLQQVQREVKVAWAINLPRLNSSDALKVKDDIAAMDKAEKRKLEDLANKIVSAIKKKPINGGN